MTRLMGTNILKPDIAKLLLRLRCPTECGGEESEELERRSKRGMAAGSELDVQDQMREPRKLWPAVVFRLL